MAATCIVRPPTDVTENEYCRPKILHSTTGWAERVQFQTATEERIAGTTYVGDTQSQRRYGLYTANSTPHARPTPTSRTATSKLDARISILLAALLHSLQDIPSAYGTSPSPARHDVLEQSSSDDALLARACITSPSSAPGHAAYRSRTSTTSKGGMDFDINFGSTSGFKTHGKKKKPAATKFDPFAEDDKPKDDGTAGDGGGNDDLGGFGGSGGGAAGGDGGDDNNGGNDDDDWGFSTGKKNTKKKSKKKQEEEEEDERKRKEEEDANATKADPLSWADDANGEGNEDWTMSWGGTKGKKEKKPKPTGPPAVPDAPPALNAFQDISLDDGAPKLDFSFDGIGSEKKSNTGGGFGGWGKSWDFDSVGKEEKKEETNEFGSNNPWGFGGSKSKTKKTTTTSSFDFGDFGATETNDLSYGGDDDVADSKADDAWGFGKKDKKKKGAIEEIKEEPEPAKEEESWGGWGTAKTKTKKKDAVEEAFAATTTNDDAFDWGFGGSKGKKKDLIGEIAEEPAANADDGGDWQSGAWGSAGKKDKKKKKNLLDDEFEPLPEAPEPPPADEPAAYAEPLVAWDFGLDKKQKKAKEKELKLMGGWEDRVTQDMVDAAEAEKAAAAVEPEPEPEPLPAADKEPLVAWDFGLSSTDKKKKTKQMKLEGTWESRITQEMVDEQETAVAVTVEPEPEPIPDPEPPPPPPLEERVPWDHGLDAKARRKKQKDMQLDGSWADRLTQEKIDQEKADAEAAAAAAYIDPIDEFLVDDGQAEAGADVAQDDTPLEDLVPWDYMLTAKEKKKKKTDMMFDGSWDDRLTQEKIDQMIADRDAKVAEPKFEPIPDPEIKVIPEERLEDLVPWDHGLTPKEKKKKKADMVLDGTWDDRLTQEIIDEKIAAAKTVPEPEPEPLSSEEPQPDIPTETLEELELLRPWDYGMTAIKKKRREKEMKADYTWDDRLTQEMIDEKIAAAKAALEPPPPPPEPEIIDELPAEAAGESLEELEKLKPWDDGLSPIEKKRQQKQMKLEGTWESRLTQEIIDEKIAAAKALEPMPEPEPEVVAEEERLPWDFGLTLKERKKKQKEMEKDGTWDDRLTQEQIDADAAAAADKANEPLADEPADKNWSFGWGATKTKSKESKSNKSLLDPEPEPEPVKEEEGWGGSWGFGKKKKDKTPEPEPEPEPVKDDLWSFGASTKDKDKKKDKKSKTADAFDAFAEESIPEPVVPPEDDIWASAGKVDKKSIKKSKKGVLDVPPPAPTPPAQGLTPEPEADPGLPSVDDFSWGGLDNGKTSKKSLAEDPPAKKSSSSMWGFGSGSSASKTKKEKEAKAKKEEEERLQHEAEEAEAAAKAEEERLAAEEEAAKAAKKSSKLSKTSKTTTSKTDGKKKSSDLLDLLDEPVPTPASGSSKLKKTSTRDNDKKLDDVPENAENDKTDYFSFWGGSGNGKKTPGKKSTDNKKEIKSNALTNEEDALLAELNEDEIQAILDDAPAPTNSKLTKTTSSSKSKTSSSVLDRVKAFEVQKEDTGKKSKSTSANLISEEAEPDLALTPKEAKKATKSKSANKSSRVDQPLSPPLDDSKKFKDSVPGSFPGGFGEDDDLLADEAPPEPGKKSSKSDKKTVTKPSKKKTADVVTFEEPVKVIAEPEDFLDDSATSPPSKKERPRVERSATTSWGFWSAAPPPKKPTRSKTLEDVSPPSTKKASVSRSKSTQVAKDKEEEKSSKASGSDKEPSSKSNERPKPTRGNSLSSFMFGGAPPSAMRNGTTERRKSTTSRSSSRRQSLTDSGVLSPPEEVTSKAAKLMGFGSKPSRRSSVKEKSKSYVDPYPIDDDDMVMINAKDTDATPKKPKPKIITDTKRATKVRSKTISGDEELVMVDSPAGMDSGNDDFEKPKLQRSNTAGKKAGLFGSLFGGGAAKLVDRTRSTPATDNEDNATPVRSRTTSRRRSTVVSPAEELTTDADVVRKDRRAKRAAAEKAEEEERQAREERRRQRREREKADLEARQERAREKARTEREAEEQRREERRARRREKEAAEREREAREMAEAEAAAERRREERRALRAKLEEEGALPSKEDRRKTYAADEDARRRSKTEGKSKSKSSGRRSTTLMAEYHESRSGSGRGIKPPENKTSSWVDSQKDEPPEMPGIEPTVLDESGQAPRPVDDPDRRRRRTKDKYSGMNEGEIAEARSRRRERRVAEKEKSSSGGSDEKDRKSSKRQSRVYEDDFYANEPKTFDARPQQTKRSSFLGKFF